MSTWSDRGLPVITFGVDGDGGYLANAEAAYTREAPVRLPIGPYEAVHGSLHPPYLGASGELDEAVSRALHERFSVLRREEFARDLGAGSAAVWLDFQAPAGLLPALPWEPLLQGALDVPVFRLPRHEILPLASLRSLSATLYLDFDPSGGPRGTPLYELTADTMAAAISRLIAVIAAGGEHTTVNVIGSRETIDWLTPEARTLPGRAFSPWADTLSTFLLDPKVPWAAQVQSVLPTAPVDLLIVAAPAIMSGQEPGLLVSGGAGGDARGTNGSRMAVSPAEIAVCATSLGAWSIALLSTGWEVRMLAHELAAVRPGPVIAAASAAELSGMYQRLLTGKGSPQATAGAAAVYVHPLGASTSAPVLDHSARADLPIQLVLDNYTLGNVASAADAPRWLAANQRVLEQFADPLLRPPPEDRIAAVRRQGYAAGMTAASSALADAYERREPQA
jgi:hypothetical protein